MVLNQFSRSLTGGVIIEVDTVHLRRSFTKFIRAEDIHDLAAITDFNAGDRIQLKGSAADYRLSSGALAGTSGSFLHWRGAAGAGSSDETIGFIQGLTPAGLSLSNSSQFIYL